MTEVVEVVEATPVQPQEVPVGLSKEDVAKEVERLMQPKEEAPVLTGMFNENLPDELAGNTAIEGLFAIARTQYPDLDFNKVMGKAWETLDPEAVDVAYLGEIVGAKNAQYYQHYFKDVIGGYANEFTSGLEEWAKGVKEQFGGEANWERVVGTFNANADQGVVAHVKGLLDSPDKAQRDVGISMIRTFVTPYGVIPKQGRPLADTNTVPGQGAGGLSAEQFMTKVAELQRTGNYNESAVAELREARKLGAQMGL